MISRSWKSLRQRQLKKDKAKFAAMQAKEKSNLEDYHRQQQEADSRAQKAGEVLEAMDEKVERMKKRLRDAQRRQAHAQKVLDEAKAKAKADCAEEKKLEHEAAAAETASSELKAANGVKLSADETT